MMLLCHWVVLLGRQIRFLKNPVRLTRTVAQAPMRVHRRRQLPHAKMLLTSV